MLSDTIIKRLTLSRYLYMNAVGHARLNREVTHFACINMMQDAIEIFLVAAAEYLNANTQVKTEFVQYIDKINEKIFPNSLPFRKRLIELNKVRIFSKHEGVRPDSTELNGYVAMARDFLDQASFEIFKLNFWTISLIDNLEDGHVKSALLESEKFYNIGDYFNCNVESRKAFYLEFEKQYDIIRFSNESKFQDYGVLTVAMSKAPYFSKNKEYIEKNVTDPFDYIVLDISNLDSELFKMRIDNEVFWNIWRITSSVYQLQNGNWLIKNDLKHANPDAECAAYVLENMIDIALQVQAYRRSQRWTQASSTWRMELCKFPVKVMEKASFDSDVVMYINNDVESLDVLYGTPGISGEGYFCKVLELVSFADFSFISGYISDEYMKR